MNRDAILTKLPRMSASCLARNGLSKIPAVEMSHDPYDVKALKTEKPRLRQNRKPKLNKTEAAFLEYLPGRYCVPRESFGVQNVTLELANGCRYTPDFNAFGILPHATFWETKGFMRDDAAVKIKVAARTFPGCRFYLVTKKRKADGGGWRLEEVMP